MIFLVEPTRYKVNKKYLVRDYRCMGCECFKPGDRIAKQRNPFYGKQAVNEYGGIRKIRAKVCTEMFDIGCPEKTGYNIDRMEERRREGWTTAKI